MDIGAFESSGFTIAVTSGSGQTAGVLTGLREPAGRDGHRQQPDRARGGGPGHIHPAGEWSVGGPQWEPGDHRCRRARQASPPRPTASAAATPSSATASGITTPASFSLTNNNPVLTPIFSNLTSPTLVYGTATTDLTGHIGSGKSYPTGSEVSVTLNSVMETALVDSSGDFRAMFNTATLNVAGSAYTVTYCFGGNTNFSSATDTSTAVTVDPLPVTLTGSRTYDGTSTAAASILTVSNEISGDNLTLSGNAALAGKNAGTENIISFADLSLGNNAAGDYTLTGATGSVMINALAVNLTGSRTYDGTSTATASILTVSNEISGDNLTLSGSAALASKDAGLAVDHVTRDAVAGQQRGRRLHADGATGSVTINALAVNLTGSRTYDGTTGASYSILTVANAISPDMVDVASGSGTLASKNAGSQSITSFGTLSLGNNAAGDYTLTGSDRLGDDQRPGCESDWKPDL